MYALYSAVLGVGLLAYLPAFAGPPLARAGYARDLAPAARATGRRLPPEPRCWIHAVSVGEAIAAVPLVEALRARWPELGIVVTTVTPTGARIVARPARTAWPPTATSRSICPGRCAARSTPSRPRFFIGMETELWPNFLRALARRGIPAMIANGRISDRSFRRYRLGPRAHAAHARATSPSSPCSREEDARRIIALGAPPERVVVTGNLKTRPGRPSRPATTPPSGASCSASARTTRVWIAGSTHRGEEAVVLDAFVRAADALPGSGPAPGARATRSAPARSSALIRERGPHRGPAQPPRRRRTAPRRGHHPRHRGRAGRALRAGRRRLRRRQPRADRRAQHARARAARQAGALRPAHEQFPRERRAAAGAAGAALRRDGRPPSSSASSRALLADRDLAPAHGRGRSPGDRGPPGRGERHARRWSSATCGRARRARRRDDPAPGARGAAAPVLGGSPTRRW